MDPHSEIEVKFAADDLELPAYHAWVVNQQFGKIDSFKTVSGTDTYYGLGEKIIRYRSGGDRESELTYKARKSAKSISDRVEINVPLKMGTAEVTVDAFLKAVGSNPEFTIHKTSHIYHLTCKSDGAKYLATLALYDVTLLGKQAKTKKQVRRFFEIEIESSSTCSASVGKSMLKEWTTQARKDLPVSDPLNSSLYEIYSEEV